MTYKFLLAYLFLIGSLSANAIELQPKKYNLSVCAIFKNEAHYLKEWIEYHRLVGVDHFYLYNNNSTDHFKRVLEPYIKKGIVSLIHWPDYHGNLEEDQMYMWALSTQLSAYENAKIKAAKESKWLALIDIDEFLVPFEKSTLPEQLAAYDGYAAVTLSRIFFDASKRDVIPRRRLVIEALELTHAQENPQKAVCKTIFKPERSIGFTWQPYQPLIPNGEKTIELKQHDIGVNRYANRYVEGKLFFGKMRDRLTIDNRTLSSEDVSALLEDGYEIEDQEKLIYRFVPQLLRNMGYMR